MRLPRNPDSRVLPFRRGSARLVLEATVASPRGRDCDRPFGLARRGSRKMRLLVMPRAHIVVMSYVPLLSAEPGETLSGGAHDVLPARLEQIVPVRGLLWVRLYDGFVPV